MDNRNEIILEMKGITKQFSGVTALNNIHFELKKGEIHALLGENGAGKSTMIKMLAGIHQPTSGEIYINGELVNIADVAKSKSLGIAVIHQGLSLVPHMTVAENIFLGRMPVTKLNLVDDRRLHKDAFEVLKKLGLHEIIDTYSWAGELTVAQQQMVEIARALSVDSNILIMDEPTASLTEREVDSLLDFIVKLRNSGVAIIYISHRLEEIFKISDRITVLRDGTYITTKETKDVTYDDVVKFMVGRDLSDVFPSITVAAGEEILRVEHLDRGRMVQDISFNLRKGEVLGFYGLVGSGRTEIMRALFGIDSGAMTHANPFFLKEVTAVKETLAQGGIDATVLSPDPANDISTQVSQITEFCTKGVDVIFIDPIDVDGIKPALVEAERVGIPVIIMDSAVTDTDLIVSFIESDNVALGKMSAESLFEAIGGEGEIAIINWDTIGAVRARVEGLKQVIEEKYNGKIEIVADQNAYGVVEDAQSIMESFMQSHPNLKGVFCINDPTAQGAIAAIEAAGKSGQIFVSSVDGSQNGIDMIKEGKLVCSPVQFPATIANKAVELAEMIWAGKQDQIEPHIFIAGDNITAENADQYDGQTY